MIGKHQDLAIYVYDIYFQSYPKPTKKALMNLLPELLRGIGSARLVIDGVDEWDVCAQKELLDCLPGIISTNPSPYICKVLMSSRDTLDISRALSRKIETTALISLSSANESAAVDRPIAQFVDIELSRIPRSHFDHLDPSGLILIRIKQNLLEKSNGIRSRTLGSDQVDPITGMFLWVRLVLDSLEFVYSSDDLHNVVDTLPSDLESLYEQIFKRLCEIRGSQAWGGVPRIISWICHAERPLHQTELLHALAVPSIDPPSNSDKVPIVQLLDHCKPLVEIRSDGTVVFAHFSVKEYEQLRFP
jgi:hypothetical protein